jgi:hypothetical protein
VDGAETCSITAGDLLGMVAICVHKDRVHDNAYSKFQLGFSQPKQNGNLRIPKLNSWILGDLAHNIIDPQDRPFQLAHKPICKSGFARTGQPRKDDERKPFIIFQRKQPA